MPAITVSAGQPIRAIHNNQYVRWLTGVTKDITTSLITTHASEYTLNLTNESVTGNILKLGYGTGTAVAAVVSATEATFSVPTTFVTTVTFSAGLALTSVTVGNGTLTAPSISFSTDTNTGLRWVSADYQALTVGGTDAIRMKNDTFGARIGFGNLDEPGVTDKPENLLDVHWSGSAANDGIVGIVSNINNDAVVDRTTGTGIPDFSGVSAIVSQTTDAADGAMRALEAHAIRAHAGAGTHTSATMMGMELGVHAGATGNGLFAGSGAAFPKSIGIWCASYQDALMQALTVAAVRADCGIFISGAAGFKSGIRYQDTDGSTVLFQVNQAGVVHSNTGGGNAAAPHYSWFSDGNTGIFWGGEDVIGFSNGGTEAGRFSSNRNLLIGTTTETTGARLKVAGGFAEFQGIANSGAFIQSYLIAANIATSTTDYGPAGIATAAILQISSTSTVNLGGFTASQVTGQTLTVINGGGSNIVLQHEVTTAAATNRFNTHTNTDYTLSGGEAIAVVYNGSRWRTVGS